ncbi:hypothetical protein H5410_008534 [Solanum commersonii]|uniref:Uncharacterized protein n=1 Tax=Solanum commersonii TaxID=4109 RepID=A0A9J6AG95_SOLCO|nr:hypothetical protein H5410_008534 [Solanum commersonii]
MDEALSSDNRTQIPALFSSTCCRIMFISHLTESDIGFFSSNRLFNKLVDNEMTFFSPCNFPLFCLRLKLQLFPLGIIQRASFTEEVINGDKLGTLDSSSVLTSLVSKFVQFFRVKCESKWTFGILHVSKPRCSDVGKTIQFLHEVHSYRLISFPFLFPVRISRAILFSLNGCS